MATAVTEIEAADGLADLKGFADYQQAFVLLRLRGHVIGTLRVPVHLGVIAADDIRAAIDEDRSVGHRMVQVALNDWLLPNGHPKAPAPTWSVVICTRDRTEQLRRCLDSLVAAGATEGEVIVVDNGPSDDATERLVERYPVHYARTDRAGLNHARSVGARIATGEIVIYTDDDVVVDGRWIPAILDEFATPRVAAVTGPGLPFELETEAQELFERHGGFSRGFERREFDYSTTPAAGAGSLGSGANMAIRRDAIMGMGLFDAELDRGTASITGGDTYALYRLIAEGYRVVYAPDAIVMHVHRRGDDELRETLYGYGVGQYSFFTRCVVRHRDLAALRVGVSWFRRHYLRELVRTLLRRPDRFPLRLVIAEIRGALSGPIRHAGARRVERTNGAAVRAPAPEPVGER